MRKYDSWTELLLKKYCSLHIWPSSPIASNRSAHSSHSQLPVLDHETHTHTHTTTHTDSHTNRRTTDEQAGTDTVRKPLAHTHKPFSWGHCIYQTIYCINTKCGKQLDDFWWATWMTSIAHQNKINDVFTEAALQFSCK